MSLYDRVVCDSADRDAWMIARQPGLGASDVARYANPDSIESYVRAKITHGTFTGNAHTERGHRLEGPILASHGLQQNTLMFHAVDEPLFFATPDGIKNITDGRYLGAQVKTTVHAPGKRVQVPAAHRRQMWWEQYVCGFEFSEYLVLRIDENGIPMTLEPTVIVFERDESQIRRLISIARPVLGALTEARRFMTEGMTDDQH